MSAAVERTKYMDADESARLRLVTSAWAIVDQAKGSRQGVVTWAVVDTAMTTGLRVSELAALRVGDLDANRALLTVTRRKRRKPAQEPMAIPRELVRHLEEFIAWKRDSDEDVSDGAPIFVGKRGALGIQGLQQIWKRAIARAGLPRELSIHSARHTLAVHLLRRTSNLRHVQKQLGHTDPATTANMYADVSFEDMQAGLSDLYGDGMADR